MQAGFNTTIRRTRGDDIDAACGQLVGQVKDRTRRNERYLRIDKKVVGDIRIRTYYLLFRTTRTVKPMTIENLQSSTGTQPPIPFGIRLQSAREAMRLERKDAAAKLRLNETVIDMMENR